MFSSAEVPFQIDRTWEEMERRIKMSHTDTSIDSSSWVILLYLASVPDLPIISFDHFTVEREGLCPT